jgi:hypothetical protein
MVYCKSWRKLYDDMVSFLSLLEVNFKNLRLMHCIICFRSPPNYLPGAPYAFNDISLCNLQMATGLPKFAFIVLLALLSTVQVVFGIRFVIDREDCFSHDIQYEGDTVHVSFVVIKVDGAWHYAQDGIDLVVSSMFLCSNLLVFLSPPFLFFLVNVVMAY